MNKWRTEIGAGAFIGSGTMLVAPVKVGAGATIGAGSTITRDTPDDKLTLERSKQVTIEQLEAPREKMMIIRRGTDGGMQRLDAPAPGCWMHVQAPSEEDLAAIRRFGVPPGCCPTSTMPTSVPVPSTSTTWRSWSSITRCDGAREGAHRLSRLRSAYSCCRRAS